MVERGEREPSTRRGGLALRRRDLVTALVYGISPHGKVAVIYLSNFTPGEIVHDARVLATS